jgi:hypothetical protein
MSIHVRAKVVKAEVKAVAGYYAHQRRYEGEEFEIEKESDFSDRWMERCSDPSPVLSKSDALVARLKAGREHKAMQQSQLLEG